MRSAKKVFKKGEKYRAVYFEDIEYELENCIAGIMCCPSFEFLRMEATSAQAVFKSLYMINVITYDEFHLAFEKIKSARVLRWRQLGEIELASERVGLE